MSLPDLDGKYIAAPADWTVEDKPDKDGKSKLQFIVQFNLIYFWNGEGWVDVRGKAQSIRGYFYIFKTDGSPNISTINNLKSALGWDGASVEALQNSDWTQKECQITIRSEIYEATGKLQKKVAWITERDADPNSSLTRAEPQVVQSLDQKYGSMLRAVNGAPSATSTTRAPLKPAAAAPATTQGAPIAAQVQRAVQSQNAAQKAGGSKTYAWGKFQSLWAAFVGQYPEEADKKTERWKEALYLNFKGVDEKTITPEQWNDFADNVLPAFDLSGIPF